ncbi:unnamed protein product [Hydatigera taeniaeformis]|uniref:BRCA-2_OB1 domain-containing protein n=1 Tax=Hydatigena taeniaeformis TaxID=6205 RepID=A0A0R3WQJ7_HYDTA|nr:unnamed protein product [Hydatigera taeniaeformis]
MVDEVEGFIQFRSPIFAVGASNSIMVKVTTSLNCLCTKPIYDVVISNEFQDTEAYCEQREAFIALLDGWMHQRVRFVGLERATLFSGQLNEVEVWCYVPGRSSVEIVPISSGFVSSKPHTCPNWPPHLLPCVDLNVTSSYLHFCAVECHGCGDGVARDAILDTHSFSTPLLPKSRIRVFGLWVVQGRYLQPGVFTSWQSADGSPTTFFTLPLHPNAASPSKSALRLALMEIFTPPLGATGSEGQEKASLWTESALNAIFGNTRRSESPSAIHLADKFIRLHEHMPSPCISHLFLTSDDLDDVSSAFQSTEEPIDLSGRTLQIFEPRATSQEVILIARLGMDACTGALKIGPIFGSKQSAKIPLLLLSPSTTDLGVGSPFGEVVLIRRPRLVVSVVSEEALTVRAFGQW